MFATENNKYSMEQIEILKKYIDNLLSDSFEGWTDEAIKGYQTALISVREKIKLLNNSSQQ